ncbi:hypothetical protein TI03_01785 [Achromatium sp. WMS1]|nr:hypothetical protein TI03_01785 [Achromatium sp. WMS1]
MQAIEIEADIDENHAIHITLPKKIQTHRVRLLVMYDESTTPKQSPKSQESRPIKLGLFCGQIHMSNDFDAPLADEFWLVR